MSFGSWRNGDVRGMSAGQFSWFRASLRKKPNVCGSLQPSLLLKCSEHLFCLTAGPIPSNGCSECCPLLPVTPRVNLGQHPLGRLSLVLGFLAVVAFLAGAWCVQPRRGPVFRAQRSNPVSHELELAVGGMEAGSQVTLSYPPSPTRFLERVVVWPIEGGGRYVTLSADGQVL